MSNEKDVILESSKKKVGTSRWNYRGFVVQKDGSEWEAKLQANTGLINQDKIEEVISSTAKTAKDLCAKIDVILGPLPGNKKKTRKIPPKKEINVVALYDKTEFNQEDAKRIAYDFRWEIESEYKKENPVADMKPVIPVRRKEIGKKSYQLGWNYKFSFIETLFEAFEVKHSDHFEFDLRFDDKSVDIIVSIKEKETVEEDD